MSANIGKSWLVVGLIPVILSCTVGPTYDPPQHDEVGFSDAIMIKNSRINYGEEADVAWWRRFGDPRLEQLIVEARRANPDLLQAIARIDQARARAFEINARLQPNISAGGSGQRVQGSQVAGAFGTPPVPGTPEQQSIYELDLDASWEIDLFGRIRRRSEAAAAEIEAAEWDRRNLLVGISARVGIHYATIVALNKQIPVAETLREAALTAVDLTDRLLEAQLGSEEQGLLARSNLYTATAVLPPLYAARHAAAAQLAILVGRSPDKAISEFIAQARGPIQLVEVKTGLPSELLLRRPDVRAAERTLAAATAAVGAETADLYPSFQIISRYGTQALSTDLIFRGASETWSYGAFIRVPLFDRAQQKADITAAEARAAAALAALDGAVLNALGETERALTEYDSSVSRLNSLNQAAREQTKALELAHLRFSAGLESQLDVLNSQRRYLALQFDAVQAKGDAFRALVGANLALGGGWEVAYQSANQARAH